MTRYLTDERIEQLELAESKLRFLEDGGVSGWEGYAGCVQSYKHYQKQLILEEMKDNLIQCINEDSVVDYPAGRDCGHSINLTDGKVFMNLLELFIDKYNEVVYDI